MRGVLVGAAMLWSGSAWAGPCAAPYAVDGLLADLVAVEQGFRDGKQDASIAAARNMEQSLPCLSEVMNAALAGRSYRAIGAGLFAGGDVARGQAWMRTAFEVDPTFSYGLQDFPQGHPVALAYDDVRKEMSPDPVPAGGSFAPGGHWLDGRKVSSPIATPDRPHLYQTDVGGFASHVIEGNVFPAAPVAVAATDKKVKPEKEKVEKVRPTVAEPVSTNASGVARIDRQRPAAKTPLLVAGSVLAAGAIGVYGYSFSTRGAFEDSTVLADVERYRTLTNSMVLASGGILAAGVGTFTWGVALDGGGAVPYFRVGF